jgi:hypothetical protein
MFFDKRRYIINVEGTAGSVNTEKLRGIIQHLIVRPESEDTCWDLTITDQDGDELMEIKGHTGRLDDKEGLFLAKDSQEKLTLLLENVSKNEPIKIIFKIREIDY